MLLVFTQYDCFKQFNRVYKLIQKCHNLLHIYPIQWLTSRMQRANQFFPSTGGRLNLSPVFSLSQDRQLRRLTKDV